MQNLEGQQIGTYRLIRLIGQGGFAGVYLGEDIHIHNQVAIKILKSDHLTEENREQFLKEASIIARLNHPHIVRIRHCGVEKDMPYIVMDHAPNNTLRHRHCPGTQLSLNTVASYLDQTAQALQYAHNMKVIHCDVKPANILVGLRDQCLVSDFGIASVVHFSTPIHMRTTRRMSGVGTIQYMAPEQIDSEPCEASDQYSLGIVVYEWLCGECPFQGTNPISIAIQHKNTMPPPIHQRRSDIPSAVETVVLKTLEKDPKDRFSSVIEFAQAFRKAVQEATAAPGPLPPPPAPPRKRLRNRFIALFTTIVLIIGGFLFGEVDGRWRLLPLDFQPLPATAVTAIIVTATRDGGAGSLREAVAQAKDGTTITFSAGLQDQIILLNSPLKIDANITLQGFSPEQRTIIRSNSSGQIQIAANRSVIFKSLLFTSDKQSRNSSFVTIQSATLSIISCIFSDFNTISDGSAIKSLQSNLAIQGSRFQDNRSDNDGGGAIYVNEGKLDIQESLFDHNTARYNGGAIYSISGNIIIINSTISNNSAIGDNPDIGGGGGIAIQSGMLMILDSLIVANRVTDASLGGGLLLSGTHAMINNTRVIGNGANTAGAGIKVITDLDSGLNGSLLTIASEVNHNNANGIPAEMIDISQQFLLAEDRARPGPDSITKEYNPITNSQFLGWLSPLDFTNFCQSIQGKSFTSASVGHDENTILCKTEQGETHSLKTLRENVDKVCMARFANEKNIISRLANYRNSLSWQCYKDVKLLGNITKKNKENVIPLNTYCKNLFGAEAKLFGTTAYDWGCQQTPTSPRLRISMAQVCQTIFGENPIAVDRMTNYNDSESWECWGPLSSSGFRSS